MTTFENGDYVKAYHDITNVWIYGTITNICPITDLVTVETNSGELVVDITDVEFPTAKVGA